MVFFVNYLTARVTITQSNIKSSSYITHVCISQPQSFHIYHWKIYTVSLIHKITRYPVFIVVSVNFYLHPFLSLILYLLD